MYVLILTSILFIVSILHWVLDPLRYELVELVYYWGWDWVELVIEGVWQVVGYAELGRELVIVGSLLLLVDYPSLSVIASSNWCFE